MGPVFAFPLVLPARATRQRLRALHAQLRAAILDGRLRPGQRLPSTRAAAAALGVSRNTALAAYDLLLSEGYLRTRKASGVFVADVVPGGSARRGTAGAALARRHLTAQWCGPPAQVPAAQSCLRLGVPDISRFPFALWRRIEARSLRSLARGPATYADAQGHPALRAAIAHHVAFTRAVACGADDVVVTAGAQQAFDLLARVLVTPGHSVVAVEEPGYPPLRAAFEAAGARLAAVRVDADGLQVQRLPEDVRVICVTPSHQFPLGCAMSLQRRAELLDFARRRGVVVVEDDYDGEFRYSERPLEALQTLDGGERVFYVGTFSKSLFPALRLGYVVTPAWARAALVQARRVADMHGNMLVQDTLASFIAEGHLARHVRRMQGVYAQRRAALLAGLEQHFAGLLQILPAQAGLHLAAYADRAARAPGWLVRAAASASADGVATLRRFQSERGGRAGLALGFAVADTAQLAPALVRLRQAWDAG